MPLHRHCNSSSWDELCGWGFNCFRKRGLNWHIRSHAQFFLLAWFILDTLLLVHCWLLLLLLVLRMALEVNVEPSVH